MAKFRDSTPLRRRMASRRVTMAGEPAGGWPGCALLTSLPARGLVAGAIMETGSHASHAGARAQAAGLKFARDVGCADPDAAASCLRDTP